MSIAAPPRPATEMSNVEPSTIEIVPVVVKKNGTNPPLVVPYQVHLKNDKQKIVWYVIDGEIGDITFEKSKEVNEPNQPLPTIDGKGKRREKELRVEEGGKYRGSHKYSFDFYPYDENGETIRVDPIAVIEY